MVKLAPFNSKLPKDVIDLANSVRKSIEDEKVHPFAGPLKAQDGKIMVEDGKIIDPGMLASMNFYVEGVVGSFPK
jgi:simple sugar transport system substrate-binding protein